MGTKHGFVFSTDAMLSIMIVALFVVAIAFFSSHSYSDYSILSLERKASDTIILLHKEGYLASQNGPLITSRVNNLTALGGQNVSWMLYIEYYSKVGTGGNVGFVLNSTVSLGQNDTKAKDEVVADRIFVVLNGTEVSLYGRARLKEWLR